MKFAKILHAESVPEWRKKYIDYKTLKALLRQIEKTNLREAEIQSQVESMQSKTSRTFSLLSDNIPGMKPLVQKMSAKFMNLSKRGSYNTPVHYRDYLHRSVTPETFLDHLNDDERTFFLKLDDELSDISKFYEGKEKEAVENLRSLKLQYKEMRELKKNKSDQKQDPASSLDEYAYKPTKEIDYKYARKNIKKAIFEFYRGIELLKNYRVLNKLGFIKILKKFDKTAGWNGSYIYMQKVDASNFVTSKVLDQVIKETENFYVDKFEGGMRRQAMMKLRLPNRERQTYYFTIWRVGMYLGISSCLCAYAVPTFFDPDNVSRALLTLFGGLLLPILFALLLGLNMYAWTKSRINYKFIFEFDSRENLDYRQFFELPSIALLILSCAVYFATLNPAFRTWYPVIFGIIFLSIFLCPFPVFYYDARRWTIMSMFRVVGAYWFRVEFRDFFIADVMNSMAYSFVILGVFGCSYIRYWPDDEACYSSTRWWVPILASIPPFWRILQCLRRYKATRQAYPHLVNTGKYVSTIIATVFLFEYRQRKGKGDLSDGMFVTWIVIQTINTIYTSMWDLVMDWSLLQSDSENLFLRDDLGYKHKGVYYFAMISNVILRFSWVSLAALRNVDSNHQNSSHWLNLVSFAIALLEMLRRLQWALFRVENEHINNCGQFRAVKEFHLPFPKGELNNVVVGRDSSSTENTSDPKNTLKKRPTATRQGSSRGMNFVRSVLPKRRPSSLTSKDFEPRLDQSAAGMADYSDGEHDEDDDELSAEEASNTSFDDDLISAERKNMEREASLKTLENQSIQNIRNSMFSNSTSLPSSSSDDKNSLYNSRKLSLPLLPRSNSSSLPGPNDPDGSAIRRRILGERTEEEMVNTQSNDIVSAGEPQQEDNLEQDVRSRISE